MSSTEKATRCMPISLGRVGSVSIAWGWMYSKSSRRPLPSGVWSMAMLAWLSSRPTAVSGHSPRTVSRPRTVRPRSVKKAMASSRSRTAMPTFSSLMGMRAGYRGVGTDRLALLAKTGWYRDRPLTYPLAVRPSLAPWCRSGVGWGGLHERSELAFQGLACAGAPPLGEGGRHRVGEDVLL